jgi:aminoglycoside phosphotransferase (APT) family kinase protein/SAM-dependent methyltransferase
MPAMPDVPDVPDRNGELESLCASAARSGRDYKSALESVLLALPEPKAEELGQLLRESRGSWAVLLRQGAGRALVIGDALSGASVALCRAGFEVVLLDRSRARLEFAGLRNEALAPGRTQLCLGGDSARLPFSERSFDVVVQLDGLPTRDTRWGHDLEECRRVCRGELVLVADNRWSYKRSSGLRGVFRISTPSDFVRAALRPPPGERSLAGYRELLRAPGFEAPRSFALYPHAREFAHVVALDAPLPKLTIGPRERRNRLKLLGHGLGLFPVLTPSFAFFVARSEAARQPPRIERVLDALASLLGEPRPEVEHLLATRGNTTLVQTSRAGAAEDDERGRWTLHIPLSPQQRAQIDTHHARIAMIRERFPGLPVPGGLFLGEIEGLYLACERRLGGLTAPHLTGDSRAAQRLFADTSRLFAELVMQPARGLDEPEFERLLGARFELVARFAAVPSTLQALQRLRAQLRERLLGVRFPRVLYHADLRSKHVQVRPDGSVLGYLDWGSSELADLPYFDLLHLVAQERKHAESLSARAAWQAVLDREHLRSHERAALDDYAHRLELPAEYCRAIEGAYPVLVAAMAEKNWDYSRPRWLHRQFGI